MKTMTEKAMLEANGGIKVLECTNCTWWVQSTWANRFWASLGSLYCPNCCNNAWRKRTV